jgi:glucokinase
MPAPAWTIGVDVGGSKTALCVAAFPDCRVLRREILKTPSGEASGVTFLDDVCRHVQALLDRAAAEGTPCRAIGVSLCELVDLEGRVGSAQRVHWRGLPVRDRFAAMAPAVVEADVRAAALAEARFGAGRTYRQFLYLNVGTGISSCWVRDGVPHAGARGHALVLASSPISLSCPHCGERVAYVLEDVAGGAALATQYAAVCGPAAASAEDVIAAAAGGEDVARGIVDRATHALGVSLGLAVNLLDPEAIVVGGGLGAAEGPYWEGLVAATREHIWSDDARTLTIRRAAFGGDSGVLGAAACAWLA